MEKQGVLWWNRGLRWALLLLAVGLLAACAKVQPKPFEEFQASVVTARQGIEKVSGELVQTGWQEMGEVYATKDMRTVNKVLRLKFDTANDLAIGPEELQQYIAKADSKLREINQLMYEYATRLKDFALMDALSDSERDSLSTSLGDQILSLSSKVVVLEDTSVIENTKDKSKEKIKILSDNSTKLFQEYLKKKQAGVLIAAIHENQSVVDDYSNKILDYIRLTIAQQIMENYSAQFDRTIAGFNHADKQGRKVIVNNLIVLNETTIKALDLCRTMRSYYAALPQAHADLEKAIGNNKLSVSNVHWLLQQAVALKDMAENTKITLKSNE
jgi:flagellar biosynthesis chaperone FliJ